MNAQTKELIRLSVEVEIQYDEGLRQYAVDYAERNCVMHLTKWPMGGKGAVEVKTTGNNEEITLAIVSKRKPKENIDQ